MEDSFVSDSSDSSLYDSDTAPVPDCIIYPANCVDIKKNGELDVPTELNKAYEEYSNIFAVNEIKLFPKTFEKVLVKNRSITEALKRFLSGKSAVLYGSLSLMHELHRSRNQPKEQIFDMCVFEKSFPVLVLTFSSTVDGETSVYNSDLARIITATVRRDVTSNFSLVHGVVTEETCDHEKSFFERIDDLYKEAKTCSFPFALNMTSDLSERIVKTLLEMVKTGRCREKIDGNGVEVRNVSELCDHTGAEEAIPNQATCKIEKKPSHPKEAADKDLLLTGNLRCSTDDTKCDTRRQCADYKSVTSTVTSGFESDIDADSYSSGDANSEDDECYGDDQTEVDGTAKEEAKIKVQNWMSLSEEKCTTCISVDNEYKNSSSDPNMFVVHIKRDDIVDKTMNRRSKMRFLHKITKIACALRNCNGGVILLHLNGQRKEDRCLKYLHDVLDKRLETLLDDGKLFIQVYGFNWLHNSPKFSEFTDVLKISIKQISGIATVDFNTKVRNDSRTENPSLQNVISCLSQRSPNPSTTATPRIRNLPNLHEDRHTVFNSRIPDLEHVKDASFFVNKIWSDLKLKHAITCLSKNAEGGSFFVGIKTENMTTNEGYDIQLTKEDWVKINDSVHDELEKSLKERISSSMCVLDESGTFRNVPNDLVTIHFHRDQNDHPRYVVEVVVKHVNGLVFHDKQGPRCYTILKGKVCRMHKLKWKDKIWDQVLSND